MGIRIDIRKGAEEDEKRKWKLVGESLAYTDLGWGAPPNLWE